MNLINLTKNSKISSLSFIIALIFSLTLAASFSLIFSRQADARVQNWDAGFIISDQVFTNSSSMSVSDIQAFLNSKVANCDTWGTQTSEFGGGTRRQWAESRGYSAPFTCLKDYSQNGQSSAQIIYNISQKYQINPQVMLVLLQKEQSLVTDTWPMSIQYRSATGYGCPDTAPCDSQYYGLTNQLDWAAKMFRSIMNASPSWYTPYIVGNNFIRYSPDASCGGSNVNIQNRATQALYNYTPYQPNEGALNADWGTANCGAYGNRNFFLYFTNWFGATKGPAYAWQEISQKIYTSDSKTQELNRNNVGLGEYMYVEYVVKNIGNNTWPKNKVLLGRDSSSPFCTNEWYACARATIINKNNDVKYGETTTFGFWMRAPQAPGFYKIYWNLLIENVAWFGDIGSNHSMTVTGKKSNDRLTSSNNFMKIGDSLISPDKSATLSLLANGNLAVYYKSSKVATLATNVHQLRQQGDGNLVAYDRNGNAKWAIGDGNIRQLIISNDGKLHYKINDQDTGIQVTSWQPDINVKHQLQADNIIFRDQAILSDNNQYRLVLQGDGNLVQYGPRGAIWATGANRGSYLVQQGDGKLVLYDYKGTAIWGSPVWIANGTNSRTIQQGDGNLVTYDGYRPIWALR